MPGDDKSLLERIELPSIPQEARSKIGRVQEALERAELEQSKCFTLSHRVTSGEGLLLSLSLLFFVNLSGLELFSSRMSDSRAYS
jgi:hypothetical protein